MQVIDQKTAIQNEVTALYRERHDIKAQIAQGEERVKIIDAQIEILRKVSGDDGLHVLVRGIVNATGSSHSTGHSSLESAPHETNGACVRLRPTDAILHLLKEHPEGLTERQVVDALEDKVITTSKNVRRLVAAMLYQQKQAKRVVKVGRLHKLAPKQKGDEGD